MVTGRNTVYSQYVREVLWQMCLEKWTGFTVGSMAERAGLKVTGNLRRQLHRAVTDGIVAYDDECIRKGTRGLHFTFTPMMTNAAGGK